MELEELYSNYLSDKGNVRETLDQTHWFSTIAVFDLLTREALPQTLSSVLRKVSKYKPSYVLKDRLWRIIEHAREPLDHLLRNLNESPQRDHAVMPFYAVRELDTPSFMALARRPGSNIREKLAGKPYLQAVRRYQSVDLPENRLLKAFSERLADLLELRVESLKDDDAEEMLYYIRSWLSTDEAQSISRWENLPPNNTLLSHRDYRQIWDAWNWLQTLEESVENDLNNLDERRKTVQTWLAWGDMYAESIYRFAEMPVLFDYDSFKIRLWTDMLHFQKTTHFSRSKKISAINEPVCIDLTELYPRYAYLTSAGTPFLKTHPNSFIWQCWTNPDVSSQPESFELFNSDAVYLHSDATTISIPELFFNHNHTPDHRKRAARAFSVKLQKTFKNKALIWLQPDYLNDFELKDIRSNINYCFPDAEPLPRSVAALFEKVDYSRIKTEGYKVLVRDAIGGKLCETWFVAKYNKKLNKCLPEETRGFYWERQPSKITPVFNSDENENMPLNIVTFDMQGKWHEAQELKNPEYLDNEKFFVINIFDSPVCGGAKYYDLQRRAGGIPLWCDQIPVLSIDEAYVDGVRQSFPLVPPKTSIIPIRGTTIPIHIKGNFTLQKGIDHYPLVMGENDDEVGYSAKLDSPDLPLQEDLTCNLKMTFTYGVDDPYCLIFEPVKNKSIQPIRVKWEKTKEEIVTDAPAPEYPEPVKWKQLQSFPKKNNSNETSDLLGWALSSATYLDSSLYYQPRKRETGVILSDWRIDKKGYHFTHAYCEAIDNDVFIYEKNFVRNDVYSKYQEDDCISFILVEGNDGNYFGVKISNSGYQEERRLKKFDEETTNAIVNNIHTSLYFPILQVWRDGRSIDDASCPSEFKYAMINVISYLDSLTQQAVIPQPIRDEILFLLSCLHKDAPDNCIQWIAEQVDILYSYDKRDAELQEERTVNQRSAIGFALGDLSKPWQKKVFNKLKAPLKNPFTARGYLTRKATHSLRIFAYAIWRESHFVEQFNFSECKTILKCLVAMLSNIEPKQNENNGRWTMPIWGLEFLLGMLRIRSSSNEDIKMLLQTHQKITKELAKQVKRIIRIVVKYDIPLESRVDLGDLHKRSDDKTPDLLYALLRNLTGKNGENAIRITGVSDNSID